MEIKNAIIESASVQIDRGFILSVWIMLDYHGTGQGFGGFVLGGAPDTAAGQHGEQANLAGDFLMGVMRAADVESFAAMKGKAVRAKVGDDGTIRALGHITREDRWYDARARMSVLCGKNGAEAEERGLQGAASPQQSGNTRGMHGSNSSSEVRGERSPSRGSGGVTA